MCWPEGDPTQAQNATAHHRYCWVVWKPVSDQRHVFRVAEHGDVQVAALNFSAPTARTGRTREAVARRLLSGFSGFSEVREVPDLIGGAEEDRTPDLCSAIAALSQLSYGP